MVMAFLQSICFCVSEFALSNPTGFCKIEQSLLSSLALRRSSDLKKGKCISLRGIACHSKI